MPSWQEIRFDLSMACRITPFPAPEPLMKDFTPRKPQHVAVTDTSYHRAIDGVDPHQTLTIKPHANTLFARCQGRWQSHPAIDRNTALPRRILPLYKEQRATSLDA